MLVLSRKQNEEICVGNDVSIKILSVTGNRVRLGIVAPGSVKVWRAEVELRGDSINESTFEDSLQPVSGGDAACGRTPRNFGQSESRPTSTLKVHQLAEL